MIDYIFAGLGTLGGICLLCFAVYYVCADYRGKIKITKELQEHLWIGISAVTMGATIFATDLSHGVEAWKEQLSHSGHIMAVQYLLGFILCISLIKHLISRHK